MLQGVLDRAYSLTGVRYGVIAIFDDTSQAEDSLAHGPIGKQAQRLWDLPDSETAGPLSPGWSSWRHSPDNEGRSNLSMGWASLQGDMLSVPG